ncbi:MAG: YraN family protein [Dictyoglomus sp.]
MNNKDVAKIGEDFTELFLKKRGFKIIEKNFRTSFGEIDIIAQKNGLLIFVEVKTRKSISYGMPIEAINEKKQNRIKKIAENFIRDKRIKFNEIRFDVMSVILSAQGEISKWEYIPNAF